MLQARPGASGRIDRDKQHSWHVSGARPNSYWEHEPQYAALRECCVKRCSQPCKGCVPWAGRAGPAAQESAYSDVRSSIGRVWQPSWRPKCPAGQCPDACCSLAAACIHLQWVFRYLSPLVSYDKLADHMDIEPVTSLSEQHQVAFKKANKAP